MARLRYNGLTATLGAPLTSSGTAVTFAAALTHSGGTAVPTIGSGDYIPLTILATAGGVSEIVWLTAYTAGATTGTITRGQEGTAGVAHASGDEVVHAPTVLDSTKNLCIAISTAGTPVPTATATLMPLPAEEYDSGGMHDTATNNSRVTIPAGGGGVYTVNATVGFSFNSAGGRAVQLFKNGTQFNSAPNGTPASSGSVFLPITLALVAGDYLEIKAYQDSGASLTATGRLAVVQVA